MSAKMYIRGKRIKSLDELMRQPFVIHQPPYIPGFQKLYHRGWFSSWQLHMAKCWIDAGSLYAAKLKTVDNCNGGNCERAQLCAEPCPDCPYCDERGNL